MCGEIADPWVRYRAEFAGIPGWCWSGWVPFLRCVDDFHRETGTRGHLVEIGVHAGRSFVGLALCARYGETAVAVDCFGKQQANRSWSGQGDLRLFSQTLGRYLPSEAIARVSTITGDALELEPYDYHQAATVCAGAVAMPFRFVHVDGGHHLRETEHDLEIAAAIIGARGVVAVDDINNPDWPEVRTAHDRFLERHPEFVPVAIAAGHSWLCRAESFEMIAAKFRELGPAKSAPWFGRHVMIWAGG